MTLSPCLLESQRIARSEQYMGWLFVELVNVVVAWSLHKSCAMHAPHVTGHLAEILVPESSSSQRCASWQQAIGISCSAWRNLGSCLSLHSAPREVDAKIQAGQAAKAT